MSHDGAGTVHDMAGILMGSNRECGVTLIEEGASGYQLNIFIQLWHRCRKFHVQIQDVLVALSFVGECLDDLPLEE